jgi:hypothetical protein
MKKLQLFVLLTMLCSTQLILAEQPNTIWTAWFNSPFNSTDEATCCIVDNKGHLYVTGRSNIDREKYLTVGYDATTGDTIWTFVYGDSATDYEANGCDVDDSGNVYITGFNSYYKGFQYVSDWVTIKYKPSIHDTIWTRRYSDPISGWDAPVSCVYDQKNNVLFVCGMYPIIVFKYNATTGDTIWKREFDFLNSSPCHATLYDSRFLFITGIDNGQDILTLKIDATIGDTVWSNKLHGTGSAGYGDFGRCCVTDSFGNLYVAGATYNGENYDYIAIKYDPESGDTIWTRKYNSPFNKDDYSSGCAVFGKNLFVTGRSNNGSNYDWLTINYNTDTGDTVWTCRYNDSYNSDDVANACVIDKQGYLYITGAAYNGANWDYYTVKYSTVTGVANTLPNNTHASLILSQSRPNPFRQSTTISYQTAGPDHISLMVYNAAGQKIKTLADARQNAGTHSVSWNGCDEKGNKTCSGVYFIRLQAGEQIATHRSIKIK